MREIRTLNAGWRFAPGFDKAHIAASMAGIPVTLPHNAADLPLSYFDEGDFQRPFTYQRQIAWEPAWQGRIVRLRFDAAMADAT
ncbi:MAG: glycoside hydrolase family 2 protein, partial [Paracoccus sp. (in: a-proteobacteria)]